MKLFDLDQIARRQHGVVTRDQTGLTESSWRRALNSGNLIRVHPGVARLVGTANTSEQHIVAAVLAAGDGAMASHRSAALLHGIPTTKPPPVDVIVPRRGATDTRHIRGRTALNASTSVVVHRPRDLERTAPHRINGIACTNVLRTLVDLGAVAEHDVNGAVGHALTNQLATLEAIEAAMTAHATSGRAGITALRRAIDDWSLDSKPADSVLEPAMRKLIHDYGLPPVEFHARVGGREVDFLVTGAPIVIECDGWRYHGRDREQFERDRHNDAEFSAHGWIVLRFTYRRITQRPSEVADQIRRAIARWTANSRVA